MYVCVCVCVRVLNKFKGQLELVDMGHELREYVCVYVYVYV